MCDNCGWLQFASLCDELARDRQFRKSEQFLSSVATTVREHRHATEKQAQAVDRIQERGW